MSAHNIIMSAAGGSDDKLYVDDVFSTYLYTGNGSTQTITNGIDLAGKGGLVWLKRRTLSESHFLYDTARGLSGGNGYLSTDTTAAQNGYDQISSFNSNGYTDIGWVNGASVVSWTFRKASKFFDCGTYIGNGVAGRQISHALGLSPGMVIVKRTNSASNWTVWHRSFTAAQYIELNLTTGVQSSTSEWNNTAPTSSVFTVGGFSQNNGNGDSYVWYAFAHDPSPEGIIQCGSFTTDSSGNATVNLGWEPQYLMIKRSDAAGSWFVYDVMRGWSMGDDAYLSPNSSSAESAANQTNPTSTGFATSGLTASATYIYLAIRRPNKPPTSGTQVFQSASYSGDSTNSSNGTINTSKVADSVWIHRIGGGTGSSAGLGFHGGNVIFDRLRGYPGIYCTRYNGYSPGEQSAGSAGVILDGTGVKAISIGDGSSYDYDVWDQGIVYIARLFTRYSKVLDIVCYTGTGSSGITINHNLEALPELMLIKKRSYTSFNSSIQSSPWAVYFGQNTKYLVLDTNAAESISGTYWNNTSPTSSVFSLGNSDSVNSSNSYIAYLFATRAGISKVGSYTGSGDNQTINCGFTTGARFILIKRTDGTGDWYVWDSSRGIVAGNDPHLSLNTASGEVTSNDSIDPHSTGFVVNQVASTNINVSQATYIYLAFA